MNTSKILEAILKQSNGKGGRYDNRLSNRKETYYASFLKTRLKRCDRCYKILLLLILNCCSVITWSQNNKVKIGADPRTFQKVLNQQFSNLITGQTKNSIGNFATLDLKEPEVSFAASHISDSGSVLTVKASGGVSDGFFQIFNNSELNTKVSLDVQYSFLDMHKKSINYDNESYNNYIRKRDSVNNKYDLKLIEVQTQHGKTLLELKQKAIGEKIIDLNKTFAAEPNGLVRDSLKYELEVVKFNKTSIDNTIRDYDPMVTARAKVNMARAQELKDLKTDIKVYGFNFGWWSIGYKVQNNAFKLFDPQAVSANQVSKESFASHEVRIQYSRYNWSSAPRETYFWLLGGGFAYGNNLDELASTELTDIKNYGINPNERTTTDKYTVYTGSYAKGLKGLRLYGDYFQFLLKDNSLALHLSPEVQIRDTYRPAYNFGVGTLFSFKSEKDETSVINAELYYNFLDLFDHLDTNLKFLERNSIGLRFTFPITFKNN